MLVCLKITAIHDGGRRKIVYYFRQLQPNIMNLREAKRLYQQKELRRVDMKKEYEKPTIEIEEYELSNICFLSGGLGDGEDF